MSSAIKAALRTSPPGKWPVMHEIISNLWCGGWVALNDDCRVLRDKGIKRVISVVSADKRILPPDIAEEHLHSTLQAFEIAKLYRYYLLRNLN